MKKFLKVSSLVLLVLCSLVVAANASTITPYSLTSFVIGSDTFYETFTVPQYGEYKAEIREIIPSGLKDFLVGFDTLIFAILNIETFDLVGWIDGAEGMDMFNFTGETSINYAASIVAVTERKKWRNIGFFSAKVSLVPLPQTLMLLGSGLIGLVIIRRRKQ